MVQRQCALIICRAHDCHGLPAAFVTLKDMESTERLSDQREADRPPSLGKPRDTHSPSPNTSQTDPYIGSSAHRIRSHLSERAPARPPA